MNETCPVIAGHVYLHNYAYIISFSTISPAQVLMLLHIPPPKKNECGALSAKSVDFFFSLSPVIIKMEVIIDEIGSGRTYS